MLKKIGTKGKLLINENGFYFSKKLDYAQERACIQRSAFESDAID
jgi:hypothetical protein